jgi:hypothetical protein
MAKPQLDARGIKMNRTKLGLLGLCALVVGVTAMSANPAQGATLSWLILEVKKTTATELNADIRSEIDSQHVTLHEQINGIAGAVTCNSLSLKETQLEAGGKLNEIGKIVFTGCGVYKKSPLSEPFPCTVKSPGASVGRIETGELKGELVLHTLTGGGEQVLAKIQARTGLEGNIVTLRLEGGGCALPESIVVHGTLYLKDFQNQATVHKLEHLVEAAPLTSLYLGGHSANQLAITKVLGSAWTALGGPHFGLDWSAMDV